MKRVFATAAVLAMLVMTGAAVAVYPTQASPTGAQAAAPSDFVFTPPINASMTGYTKPAVVGANGDGSVQAPFSGTDNTSMISSYNQTYNGPFSNVLLDQSGSGVGSERAVSDSQGRVHLVWFHGIGSTPVIYYGRHDPGAGSHWFTTVIPNSDTNPGYKVVGIARGQNVGAFDRIWVMWARNGVGARVAYTDNGGASWSPFMVVPGPFSTLATDFNIGATTGGQLFVGWFDRSPNDILVQMLNPNGQWGPVTDASRRPVKGQDYTPRFGTGPDGSLNMVWTGFANSAQQESDVFYRQWTPDVGWSPTIVQLFSTPGVGNSRGLEIVTDPAGVNHVVWDDDSGRQSKNVASYYIRGSGVNWTAPQNVFPDFGSATTRYPYVDYSNGPTPKIHIVGNSFVAGPSDNFYTSTDDAIGPVPTATPAFSPTPCSIGSYSDVPPEDPFYRYIHDLAVRGAISGYSDCSFHPYNEITRAQIAKVIVLAFGYQTISPPNPDFTDVPYGSPFYDVIETAYQNGIISGYSDHTFRPNNNVTRGQITKMVVLGRHWNLLNPSTGTFEDVLPNTAFYQTVETAVAHGIISGYNCGGPGEPCDAQRRPYFRQNNTATRAQASKIIDLAIYSNDLTPTPAGTATPTETVVPPTATETTVPLTSTPTVTGTPPTSTPVPPTATTTNTPVPPTATSTSIPGTATRTSVPGTATATPTP